MNKHVFLLLLAAVLWSLGGVLIKSIDWTPLAIAGSRSLIATVIIGLFQPATLKKLSWRVVPGALAYTATVILFVVATKLTTAANAIFLQYTAPIYIALIGPWFLGERTRWQDWVLVAFALCGIVLFFSDRLSLDSLWGIIAALASGLAFAWLTILMRHQRKGSPEAVVLLGNVVTCAVTIPWMIPVVNLQQNGPWLLALGVVQLAVPYLLYSVAIRHVRALNASLISIIEPILNPLWVMLLRAELPAPWSIVGGAIVLTSSVLRSVLTVREHQVAAALPAPEAILDESDN